MKRCIIITALLDCRLFDVYQRCENDYIICADGGVLIAEKCGIVPDVVLGDLDSVETIDKKYNFIKHPKEKDDTDTLLCIKYGMEKGFKDFLIIGGIGGRLDHTVANLQTLAFSQDNGIKASILSKDAVCTMISDGGRCEIPKMKGFYISVFAYSDSCKGVSINGTKYELSDKELKNTFPLGVSNEFKEEKAVISVDKGKLLIIVSRAQ